MAEKIEIPVSLGLLAATLQIQELRAMLEKSVDIKSTAFRSIDLALSKALNLVNNLKASMSTAFLNTSSAKKFSADLEKTFRLILAIGESFGNLGQKDLIFSPEAKTLIDDLQNQMRSLNAEISRISAGRIGNVFDDSSIENFRQVLDMAALLGVVLSKTTFEDFSSQISNKMAEVRQEIESTKAGIENLKNAANNPAFTKESLLLSLTEKTDLSNIIEKLIDATSAKNLREKIAAAYSNVGLEINEALAANVKSGLGIDSVLRQLTENLVISATAFETAAKEKKQEISLVIEDLTGLTTSNRYGNSGQTYDRNEKLGLIQDIKTKYASLIDFSKFDELDPNKMGIREYIRHFQETLEQGFKDIDGSTIEKALKENISAAINSALTKDVITDTKSFLNLVLTVLKGIFGDLTFDIQWSSFKGSTVDKAFSDIIQNITNTITSFDPTTASEKIQLLELSLLELKSVLEIVNNTATADGSKLQGLLNNYNNLATAVASVVQETLKALGIDVSGIFARTADSAHGATSAVNSVTDSLAKFESRQKSLSNIQMAVNRWMGFWQVLNMTKSAINDMKLHIQELDTVMTSISVVTNFSQEDLWGQISQYSEIARQYGVAIKGVYEVSLIYYQLGLLQNDVMTLTTETLKMARIAGLDYATAADYMTTAIRGFKLEMTDAAHVTDVFSALAATTASSTEEIATAISKTAASAEAVGASFEATSAMMATMIATTRESATNIGTALKSVISRYGEMTSDPSKTVDSEGEEMSLNRVDKALLTVGITIHDTAGQFRDFDDVMLELMEKWDSLDSLSQRYIATLMAGNRQQSRFLALVSNVDEYKKALETAMDSEGAGELLTLKTLDSIDAKIEKMKVTIQEFYTSSGIEELYKNILDSITNIVSAANSLPKAFGKIPLAAVAMGGSIISAVKSAIKVILGEILAGLEMMKGNTQSTMTGLISMMALGGRESGKAYREAQEAEMNGSAAGKSGLSKGAVISGTVLRYAGAALNIASAVKTLLGMNAYGASSTKEEDQSAATQVRTGGILGILGSAASGAATGTMISPGWGTAIGAGLGILKGVAENIATLTSASEMYNVSLARQIELSGKRLEADKQEQLEAKNTEKQLEQAYTKLKELEEHLYDSVEAQLEYHDYMNLLADSYPAYVEKIDLANNAIIYSGTLEEELARARELTAAATRSAIEAELDKADLQLKSINNFKLGLAGIYGNDSDITSLDLEGIANLVRKSFSSDIDNFNNEKFIAGLTEEEAAEYLVKAYAARTPQNIPGYDRKNRTTVGGTLLPSGDFIKTSYRQILNTRDGNGLTLLDKIMSDSELNLGAGEDAREAARTLFKSLLTDLLAESEKAGLSVSLATITKNKNIENVDDILSLTDTEFTNAVSEAKLWADSLYKTTAATKLGIRTALIDALAREKVTTLINTLENKLDRVLAEQYKDLITYGMSAKFGQDIDTIDSNLFNEAFTKLSDWIKNNQESAEALANIDYSQYTTFDKLKESIENFGDLDDKIEGQIESDFNEARTNAVTLYTNLLTSIFGDGKAPNWLTDTDQFTNRTLTAIQSDLKQYLSLIEKQQYAQAEAYLHNTEAIYGEDGFGQLTDELQTQAYDVIKDLDLSDPEALHAAAETLANMGIGFKGLSDTLINAASRWTTSAATLLEQLASSTKDTAKSIESSIADMSKVFKYSEALEKAQALMDANEGVKFDEIFTYDKDLGGYIKTAKAFLLEMAELLNLLIEGISLAITDMTKTLSSVFDDKDFISLANSGRTIETGLVKEKFAMLTHTKEGDANFDRLWLEYTLIIEAFRNQDEDWNTFITEYISEHGTQLLLLLDEINNMSSQMALLLLKSFDYTSIVSGKGTTLTKETLKALLIAAGGEHYASDIALFFDEYYTKLITGNVKEYNNYLKHFGLSDFEVTESQANRARFEALKNLYDKIASGDVVYSALEPQEQELLKVTNELAGFDATDMENGADAVQAAIWKLYETGVFSLKEMEDSIANTAENNFKNSNAGKLYNLLTSYKDGFTALEAATLGLLNKETGELRSEFSDYLELDSNGNWVIKAGLDAASVILNLARLLNISIDKTTDEYKDAIKDGIDQAIANADKADIGKQRVNAWQSIMSGKVSDRISLANVDDTTKSYMKAAGLISDMNADFVYILSEELLNNAIEWMRDKLSDQSFVQGNLQTARYFLQLVSDFESKTAKNAAFEGIIGEQFNLSAAEALSMALLNTTEYSKVQSLMTDMGFKWDLAALVWKASAESIEATRNKIRLAFSTGEIDNETYLNLIASLNETAEAINPKTKLDNAILDMLLNYNNVSEAMRAAFINNFYQYGIKASDFLTKNDHGTYDVNIGALKSFLDSIGFEYDEAARSEIEAITDSYLSNIQTAATYSILGASSLADIEAFRLSYEDIVHESLDVNAFQYNSLTQSFILDPAAMHKYIDAQKEILTGMGYTEEFVNAYITDLTDKAILASIELDNFLNANTNKSRNDEANKLFQLIRSLSNYFDIAESAVKTYFNKIVDSPEEEFEAIIAIFNKGGLDAVDLLKQIKPDASQEEFEAVYNASISKLREAQTDLGKGVGETVSGITAEIMRTTEGFELQELPDGSAVIIAVGDMAKAYSELYARMLNDTEHTTSDLNHVYALIITAEALSNVNLKEALSNAGGMSADSFATFMDSYGLDMHTVLTENALNIIIDLFGNIIISNFKAFTEWMNNPDNGANAKWNPNDPALKELYSQYTDTKVKLHNQIITDLQTAFDLLSSILDAKVGQAVNVSYLGLDQIEKEHLSEILQRYAAYYEDGILTIGNEAAIPELVKAIGQEAVNSGAIIPQLLAELNDAIAEMLDNIISLLSNGISGSLNLKDTLTVIKWYHDNAKNYSGLAESLDMTNTADGLQFTESSLANIYELLKRINELKADQFLDEIISSKEGYLSLTGALKEYNDALKNTNTSMKETATMMKDIVQKAMVSPDSMNFMSDSLPEHIQTAVNAWENASSAISTLTEAEKNGYMGVQDFYNIVQTASSLMLAAGKDFEVAGMNAAELMQAGAENVKVADGKLTVDLSASGMNIIGSVGDLKSNLTTGINELADAEIAMIDAEILVLEILAAMEQLGDLDVDVDNNGLSFEILDIFDAEGPEGFTDSMKSYMDAIIGMSATSKELEAALKNTQINSISLYDLLQANAKTWEDVLGSQENVSKFWLNFSAGIEGWDPEGNVQEQVLNFFKGLDTNLTVDLGENGFFTIGVNGVISSIDYNNEEIMKDAENAIKSLELDVEEDVKTALKLYATQSEKLTFKQSLVLKVAAGTVKVVYDPKNKDTITGYSVNGITYTHANMAAAVADLVEAGVKTGLPTEDIELPPAGITGTIQINEATVKVMSLGAGVKYIDDDGHEADSAEKLFEELYSDYSTNTLNPVSEKVWRVRLGISVEPVFEINGNEANISTNLQLRTDLENYVFEQGTLKLDTKDQKYIEVELNTGVKWTIPKDKLKYDDQGNVIEESFNEYRQSLLEIDLPLKDTITSAITSAIPSLTDALSKLDAGPALDVAKAVKEIGDNAQNAITLITSLTQKLKGLPLQKESNGSKNSGTGAGAHEPEAITGEVSIEGTEKAELDINAFSDTIGSLDATVQSATGSVSSTASNMASKYSQAMSEMDLKTLDATGSTRTHLEEMLTAALTTIGVIVTLIASLPTHISITTEFITKTEDSDYITTGGYAGETGEIKQTVRYTTEGEEKIEEVKKEASQEVTTPVNADTDAATLFVNNLIALIETARTVPVNVEVISDSILSYLAGKTYTANATVTASGGEGPHLATGNIGLAKAKGTLMGELGPELVVSNGRYFVAGLNGAEMVNLADDAIVFNHLQTEQLLKHGMSSGRGKAVTSEKNAVAFATGNTGPAMASASAALNALKQLRAMWESLRSASISDLAGAGGGGGGGGGDKAVDPSIWIDTVERWYNLMQKIAKLEKEITHEETLRSKLESDWNANGNHYYASQKRSLEALRDLIDAQEQLNLSRLAYYDLRVEALEKSPFGKLIRFDDEGQMFFLEGAMEWLTKLAGFDSEGKANYTDEEKYDILMKAGYGDYMKYDSNGGEIKKDSDGDGEVTDDELQTFYGDATKAFWDRINDYKEATLSLWDSIKDGEDSLLDLQADLNSLLEEIRENQMEVEDLVLKAIEDLRQREIDALQDERDKLEESTLKYIDGLTDALNREQEMYLNLEDETSLNQQRRRLAILQRSGGSAEDIASLRSEIDSSERERYFNLQQQQIDAILEASDLEIERMDSLIEIMTETLEYQKEYGLLWGNVYAVMQESADKIVSFITHGNSEFWTSSELASLKAINEQLFAAEQWTSYRDDLAAAKASIGENGVTAKDISENVLLMATMTREQMKDNDYRIFDEAMKKEFGNDYDKNGAYKDIFYSEYQEHGDLTKVTASARKKYSDDKKAAEAAAAVTTTSTASGGGGGNSNAATSGSSGGSNNNKGKTVTSEGWAAKGGKHRWVTFYSDGTSTETRLGNCDSNGAKKRVGDKTYYSCSVCGNLRGEVEKPVEQKPDWSETRNRLESKGISPNTGTAGSAATTKTIEQAAKTIVNNGMNFIGNIFKSISGNKKASGGYVNHGVYELGELGTETVLTASQTKVLRDNILSNRPNSLISLLRSYNENYDGINSPLTGITPVEDNSVTIERVEMTMEVKQIANDYDAKRAGEQALNEMMRIARKTGATNSIRR